MKKQILALISTVILSTSAFSTTLNNNSNQEIMIHMLYSQKISNSDSSSNNKPAGTEQFAGTVSITKGTRVITVPVLHTKNDKGVETISINRQFFPNFEQEIKEAGISKEEINAVLKKKYSEVNF